MPHETTAWKCNFCHRCFSRRVGACNHEYACKYNPARRMCFTCKHYDPNGEWTEECSDDFFDETIVRTHHAQICNHFEVPLSAQPWFEDCELSDIAARPIPGTCHHWEPKEPEGDNG